MSRPTSLLVCTLAALASGADTDATELSGGILAAQCRAYADDPESEQGQRCVAFITGFLAGLAASDATARTEPETYSERALRTRLGLRLVGGSSEHCVDASTDALIGQLLAQAAERPPDHDVTAGDLVRETLQRFHACNLMDRRRSL